MPIRIPIINSAASYTPYTGGNTAAAIYSIIPVLPVAGKFTINGIYSSPTNITPVDTDTITINGSATFTYTFRTTLTSDTRDVLIDTTGSNQDRLTGTLENLQQIILKNHSTSFKSYFNGSVATVDLVLVIEAITAGSGNDCTGTTTSTLDINNASDTGHNGAQTFDSHSITFDIDQVTGVANPFGTFLVTDGAAAIASVLTVITGVNASVVGTNRIKIERDTIIGTGRSVKINAYSGTPALFAVGEFAKNTETNQADSDEVNDDVIYLAHPTEPYFYRNDNRPILGLYQNEHDIYRELIALRDGYDIDNGSEISSVSHLGHFKAQGGIHIGSETNNTDLHIYGDIILHNGQTVEQSEQILQIADKTITLNVGETGSGVTGSGLSGVIIDRGSLPDSTFLWNENLGGSTTGEWDASGSIRINTANPKLTFYDTTDKATIQVGSTSQLNILNLVNSTDANILLATYTGGATTNSILFRTNNGTNLGNGIDLRFINTGTLRYSFRPVENGTSFSNNEFYWDRTVGQEKWVFEGPVLFTGAVTGADQIVTIGDGISTLGDYNATDAGGLATAISNAIGDLPSGGKVFIYRGSYTLNAHANINTDNITIEGEGAGTEISLNAASTRFRVATAANTENILINKIRFVSTAVSTAQPIIDLNESFTATNCIITHCWFIGSGNPDVDLQYLLDEGHIISNCISTTATTRLP